MDVYVLYMNWRGVCTVHTCWDHKGTEGQAHLWIYGSPGMCVIFSEGPAVMPTEAAQSRPSRTNPDNMCVDGAKQWPWIEISMMP